MTDAIIIDGHQNNPNSSANTNSFELGSNAVLDIVLDGSQAPQGTNGLTIEGGDSVVRGLVIQRFVHDLSAGANGFGIVLGVKGGNLIEGNFLGTDVDGVSAMPNTSGIAVASDNNTIGGTADAARNVISGNVFNGIQIGSTRSGDPTGGSGNRILGNYIGTTVTGDRPLPNDNGIRITTLAGWNIIGGTADGAGNVLSGNRFQGILMDLESSGGNVVLGNFIGTDPTGNVTDPDGTPGSGDELGNRDDGVDIAAPNNTIGGPTREAGNVISGNGGGGVLIAGLTATNNLVQNNRIGTNAAGTWSDISASLGNGVDGAQLQNAPGNRIEDNLISDNGFQGVGIVGVGAVGNQIQGNLIGTDVTGSIAMGNRSGVGLFDAPSNIIGGTRPNVISGNTMHGVHISGVTASDNLIEGNYIGTDVTGLARLANQFDGVRIVDAPRTTIGGADSSKRNLISGNDRHGVHISGTTATGNQVLSNTIGLDLTGQNKLGNRGSGVVIDDAPGNMVGREGGPANVIAGNSESGILIKGANAVGNLVAANLIGTNQGGSPDLGNAHDGITLIDTMGNFIGGHRKTAGNLISGNLSSGVKIEGGHSNNVYGNLIGTDNAVTKALPNHVGVGIFASAKNSIGGVCSDEDWANVISGNLGYGVHVGKTDNTLVYNNFTGLGGPASALPNIFGGVFFEETTGNSLGGRRDENKGNSIAGNATGPGVRITDSRFDVIMGNRIGNYESEPRPNLLGVIVERSRNITDGALSSDQEINTIPGNVTDGIVIDAGQSNSIRGNVIGLDANAETALPNGGNGVVIRNSRGNEIGRDADGRFQASVISGNLGNVILIEGLAAKFNSVRGKFIGTKARGDLTRGNGLCGIRLYAASENLIGGALDPHGNLISGHTNAHCAGVSITGGRANIVQGNRMGTDKTGTASIPNADGLEVDRLQYEPGREVPLRRHARGARCRRTGLPVRRHA